MDQSLEIDLGMMMGEEKWIDLNTKGAFDNPTLLDKISPFPPPNLMRNVSGLTSQLDFAAHGAAIFSAIKNLSPTTLSEYQSILDFGCGCGRFARFLKGHPQTVYGCDVDPFHVAWINKNLPFMRAKLTKPNQALPFDSEQFDCVISISVFTHMDEQSQLFYLGELARCTKPGAYLFLSTHGERALARATTEDVIFSMLEIPTEKLSLAHKTLMAEKHSFILQQGHLTTDNYPYGITFIPPAYIKSTWIEYFDIISINIGAIHNFQDIIVCRRR